MPFDPRRAPNERDLVLAMTDAEGGVMMDYFDQSFLKNWAGPEHWKLRKVVRRREFSPDFIDRLLRFKCETNVSMLRSFVLLDVLRSVYLIRAKLCTPCTIPSIRV